MIINPANGPTQTPDENYQREISKLAGFTNIQLLGYVRTNYTQRPIDNVLADVTTWSTWSGFQGIFFDETPNSYTDDIGTYLSTIDAGVGKSFAFVSRLKFI